LRRFKSIAGDLLDELGYGSGSVSFSARCAGALKVGELHAREKLDRLKKRVLFRVTGRAPAGIERSL